MTLAPILPGVTIHTYDAGRYKLQLEVPADATLSPKDIENICRLASWEGNPFETAPHFEGERSLLINREAPTTHHGLELAALQVSGIGYFRRTITLPHVHVDRTTFHPPSTDNYQETIPLAMRGTSRASGNRIVNDIAAYRPLGTYERKELEAKIKNTRDAQGRSTDRLVVSKAECWGRYLDPDLSYEGKQFGFLVVDAPSVTKRRLFDEFSKRTPELEGKTYDEALTPFYEAIKDELEQYVLGVKELHKKRVGVPRRVHLQPHLANAYLINGTVYMTDWSSTRRLRSNEQENAFNIALELSQIAKSVATTFWKNTKQRTIDPGEAHAAELAMLDKILLFYGEGKTTPRNFSQRIIKYALARRPGIMPEHCAAAEWILENKLS